LLVFPSGTFNEDNTFLLTDWLAHVPTEVLAKNLRTDAAAFAHIPGEELYIFPSGTSSSMSARRCLANSACACADPLPTDASAPADPNGRVPEPFSYAFSRQAPTRTSSAGSIKIADSSTFKVSEQIAVAEVSIAPGHMRELHWHPTGDGV
jgi:oxalate decarboxylase/phosphoglucose isomerase-like protein (cupin superfamily)